MWFWVSLRVKRFDCVEVAPTVNSLLTSGVVVPMAKTSVTVVGTTAVPRSVQPAAESTVDQLRLPEPSIFKKVLADWEEGQV